MEQSHDEDRTTAPPAPPSLGKAGHISPNSGLVYRQASAAVNFEHRIPIQTDVLLRTLTTREKLLRGFTGPADM